MSAEHVEKWQIVLNSFHHLCSATHSKGRVKVRMEEVCDMDRNPCALRRSHSQGLVFSHAEVKHRINGGRD